MGHSTTLHQITLVSYGTRFLRGDIALAAFARHGVFEGKPREFRDGGNPRLPVDDFTLWLEMLRERGAQRLSLHLIASLPIGEQPDTYPWERALVVHFAGHCQVWRCCSHDSGLDVYWPVQTVAGPLEVPLTNWTALMSAVRKDLDIPANCPPSKPFFGHWWDQPETSKLPVFPYASTLYLPHQLMEMLGMQREQIKNVLISKNENSYYHHLSPEEAAKVDDWAERLHCWIGEVELRCANEFRAADVRADDAPLARMFPPPPPAPPRQIQPAPAPLAPSAAGADLPPAIPGRWQTLLGLLPWPFRSKAEDR